MAKNDWLIERLRGLDDEGFVEVLGAVSEKSADTEVKPNDEIIHITQLKDEIEASVKNWGQVQGLSTGYTSLDEKVGGLADGALILIGGDTSQGKSALASNIACNVAKEKPVLFITLEMLKDELGARLHHINGGSIDDLDLMFQAEHRLTYKDLKPLIQKAKEMGEVKLIVLDYLQYLGRGMTLSEVAKMSKEMKSLALDFKVPFIVIVSLRKGEQGKNKRKWTDIEVDDLMGTASIGYDADVAMITSRKDLEGNYNADKIYIKVLKTRNVALDFHDRIIELDWEKTKITEDWSVPTERKDLV